MTIAITEEEPLKKVALQTIRYQPEDSVLAPVWVTYVPYRKMWITQADYLFKYQDLEVLIPAGFEFDLSSVPRIIWPLISSFELSIVAPLIHDYLFEYSGIPVHHTPKRTVPRSEANDIFYYIMLKESVPKWKAKAAYTAVKLFSPRY